jgi:hypothetical protein
MEEDPQQAQPQQQQEQQAASAAAATAGAGAGGGEQGEQQPKRAKRGAEEEGEGDEGGVVAMAVDVPSTEEEKKVDAQEQWRRELEAHLATADEKPPAPDMATFFEKPLEYSHKSPCLLGTVDGENNTALILSIKHASEKCVCRGWGGGLLVLLSSGVGCVEAGGCADMAYR